jgi:hypothetical protein
MLEVCPLIQIPAEGRSCIVTRNGSSSLDPNGSSSRMTSETEGYVPHLTRRGFTEVIIAITDSIVADQAFIGAQSILLSPKYNNPLYEIDRRLPYHDALKALQAGDPTAKDHLGRIAESLLADQVSGSPVVVLGLGLSSKGLNVAGAVRHGGGQVLELTTQVVVRKFLRGNQTETTTGENIFLSRIARGTILTTLTDDLAMHQEMSTYCKRMPKDGWPANYPYYGIGESRMKRLLCKSTTGIAMLIEFYDSGTQLD